MHYIVNPSHISHTQDLDHPMLDRHMVYRPSQPRSQDVDLQKLYHQSVPYLTLSGFRLSYIRSSHGISSIPATLARCRAAHVISSHIIVNSSHITHTLDLDRPMLDRHMVYRPSQPRSQDVDLHMLYRHTSYRQSVPLSHTLLI